MPDEFPPDSNPQSPSAESPAPAFGPEPVAASAPLNPSPEPIPEIRQYRDRGTGLIIFGVLQIILGLLAALMIPLAALGTFLIRLSPGGAMRPSQFLSGIASYAFIAAGLLTLGIGSVQMKRWARAVTLVVSWYWMITGILIIVLLTAVLPVTMRTALQAQQRAAGQTQELSTGIMAVILTIVIVMAAVFLVVVPVAFVVFYGRKDVAETCRAHDPAERWTDRIPLPVLGACVVLAIQCLTLLVTGLSTPLFPFFGRYLTGYPAMLCFLLFACLDGCLAVAFYGLKPAAWWIAVIAAPVRLLSMAFTYARADVMQAYSRMGWSDAQMQVLNSSPFFRSHVILWWSLLSAAVIFFGYLLWLRRYFNTVSISPGRQVLPAQVG